MDIRICFILALGALGVSGMLPIGLRHRSTVFVPFAYGTNGAPDTFSYDDGVAEQVAVDKEQHIAYTIGSNLVHVVDFSDPKNAALVAHKEVIPLGSGSLEDITFCRDWVAVCVDNATDPLKGRVLIFSKYDALATPAMKQLHNIEVGALPDSANFTSDCSKLLVAIEGEVRNVAGTVVDPEGGVRVLDFNVTGPIEGATFTNTFKDFTQFNAQAADYIARGVRKTYNGEFTDDIASTTFSQDMEPESIALSPNEEFAYVQLQENNAVAVLNINNLEWVDIYPLGTKSFDIGNCFGSKLDASDRDDAINIANWPVQGLFQPDGAAVITWRKRSYLVTANEGSPRSYKTSLGLSEKFEEDDRGDKLIDFLSPSVSQSVRDKLNNDTQLGRLQMSLVDGLDAQGDIVNLTTFGGRSISLFSTSDFSLVDDSGSEIAETFAAKCPFVFNGDAEDTAETPFQSFDGRSDNRGVEPESIATGIFGRKRQLIFVGLERPGAIAVYSVRPCLHWPWYLPKLKLESIYYGGGDNGTETWGDRYNARSAHALDVEDLTYLTKGESPVTRPLLVAAGSVSGTLSFFEVKRGANF